LTLLVFFCFLFFIVLLFVCAYKAWVISPPWPPLPGCYKEDNIKVDKEKKRYLFAKKWK
jgi:hypothetical protein